MLVPVHLVRGTGWQLEPGLTRPLWHQGCAFPPDPRPGNEVGLRAGKAAQRVFAYALTAEAADWEDAVPSQEH